MFDILPKNTTEERNLIPQNFTPKSAQHQVSKILGPPENGETNDKTSNAEVMENDLESLLPADLDFEVSDDAGIV